MPQLPGQNTYKLQQKSYLGNNHPSLLEVPGDETRVKSQETVTGADPTHRLPPGTVVVLDPVSSKYVVADGATGAPLNSSQASITSKIDISANAASKTFKWRYKEGTEHTVTLGGADDTPAEVRDALNADANFSRNLIASLDTNKLVIKTLNAGDDEYFEITDGTLNDMDGVAEDTFDDDTVHAGSDLAVRVLAEHAELKDLDANDADAVVRAWSAGHFLTAGLSGLTDKAKAILRRNGSKFD